MGPFQPDWIFAHLRLLALDENYEAIATNSERHFASGTVSNLCLPGYHAKHLLSLHWGPSSRLSSSSFLAPFEDFIGGHELRKEF